MSVSSDLLFIFEVLESFGSLDFMQKKLRQFTYSSRLIIMHSNAAFNKVTWLYLIVKVELIKETIHLLTKA